MSYARLLKQELFSNENVDYLLSNIIKNIEAFCHVTLVENEHIMNVFEDVCVSIFDVEIENNIDINDLNNIIIQEMTSYITDDIQNFETTKIRKHKQSNNEHSKLLKMELKNRGISDDTSEQESDHDTPVKVVPKKKNVIIRRTNNRSQPKSEPKLQPNKNILNQETIEYLNLNINEIETKFYLDNVTSVELKVIDVINSDYIITENNNTLSYINILQDSDNINKKLFSEEITVKLPVGNYTKESFVDVLNQQLKCDNIYAKTASLDPLTEKLIIESETTFELKPCVLLDLLGIKCETPYKKYMSHHPFDLRKRRTLPVKIIINDTEPIIDEIVHLNEGRTFTTFSNIIKSYTNKVSISNIYVDFGDYNFRNTAFYIQLQLKYYK
jgi:hypothetical protein